MSEQDLVDAVMKTQTQEEFAKAWDEFKHFLYMANDGIYKEGLAAQVLAKHPGLKEHIKPFWKAFCDKEKQQ